MKSSALWLLFMCGLGACAHSPDPTFYALSAREGPAIPSRALKIELRRAGLPGYLDRPHIVRRSTAEQLELAADERWGAPLDEMVGATLAENLAQRLPACVVFTDAGPISSAPDLRVEAQLFRFERLADGKVALVADVAVHAGAAQAPTIQRFAFTQTPAGNSSAQVVASLSELLAKLSDGVAIMVLKEANKASAIAVGAAP